MNTTINSNKQITKHKKSNKKDCPCRRMSAKDRKKQILTATREFIFSEGTSRFTLKKISNMIGITEAGVYRHFATKEEVILALLDSMFDPWKAALENLLNDDTPEQYKILLLGKLHIHFLTEAKVNPMLFFSDALSPTHKRIIPKLLENFTFINSTIFKILSEGLKNNRFKQNFDVSAIQRCILGTLQGFVLKSTLQRALPQDTLIKDLDKTLITLIKLIGADTSSAQKYVKNYRRFIE